MSQPPPSPDPLKALMQAHGLRQPSAAFAAALPQLVAARYTRSRPAPFRAGAWLGKAVLLVLAGLLLLTGYAALPVAAFTVLGPALAAGVLGTGSVIWLLEQSRKRLLLADGGQPGALTGIGAAVL